MTYPVKSIKVSHDILATMVDRGTVGVTEIATALDVPKSTAHDHLRTLEQVGYVVNEGGRYRLGAKLYHLGETARSNHELFTHGRDEALALADHVDGKHVQLATAENGTCVILLSTGWREGATQTVPTYPANVPLHTNAPGKAILAHESAETLDRIVETHGLTRRTANTITDRDRLAADLETVQERGYAVDDGELLTGMQGIAAPVVTDAGVHGAISVYSSADRFDDYPADSPLVDDVTEAARTIEANLIFTPE